VKQARKAPAKPKRRPRPPFAVFFDRSDAEILVRRNLKTLSRVRAVVAEETQHHPRVSFVVRDLTGEIVSL